MTLFIVTAYVASQGSLFANGEHALYKESLCVVAATKSVPFGTLFVLEFPDGEVRVCEVKDRIGRPLAGNHLDVLFPSRREALLFGKRELRGNQEASSLGTLSDP